MVTVLLTRLTPLLYPLNFALTHSFKPSASQAAWDIYLVPQQPEVFSSVWNVVDVWWAMLQIL